MPRRLQKEITLQLHEDKVHVTHRVTWHGEKPFEFAPWGITQLRLGSVAILPQPNANGLGPNRSLVLWPYSQINDQRLELHDDLVLLHGHAADEACKIGNYNMHGWVAGAFGNALFIKKFQPPAGEHYPDLGCNVEAYVKDFMSGVGNAWTVGKIKSGRIGNT